MSDQNGVNGKHNGKYTPPMEKKKECGAQLRGRPGRYCRKRPMANGRCQLHGGKTPSGPASPHFKTGKFCRSGRQWYWPHHLTTRFNEALEDRDLLSLSKEAAAFDIRIQELIEKLDKGDSGPVWDRLSKLWAEFERLAKGSENQKAQAMQSLPKMGELIKNGKGDRETWRELRETMVQRAAIVKTETDRRATVGRMVPTEQVFNLIHAMIDLVIANVHDRATQLRISRGLMALADTNGGVVDADGKSRPAENGGDGLE